MSIPITHEVWDFLMALEKELSAGKVWTKTPGIPGTVFAKTVRDWAVEHKLAEANTIDGEMTAYRITIKGIQSIHAQEAPEAQTPVPKTMSPEMFYFLNLLARFLDDGDDWLTSKAIGIDKVSYFTRKEAQTRHFVEGRGNNHHREFKITPQGLSMIGRATVKAPVLPIRQLTEAEKQQRLDESIARIKAKRASEKPIVSDKTPSEDSIRTFIRQEVKRQLTEALAAMQGDF